MKKKVDIIDNDFCRRDKNKGNGTIIFESTQGHEHCSKCGSNLYATRWLHNEWLFMCPKCLRFEG